ncbi:GNAT family N-acetyltransferase [Colwellia demingiae]|nr:GNAT family N-acetyltransferase [Colwellia demingiae]
MHSFTTERLLIRPLAVQDKALYLSLYCNAKIMKNIGEPLSLESAQKAFHNTLKAMDKTMPKVLTWAIVNKITNETIGIQALSESSQDDFKIAEIGIMLSTKANGKQFPEEAMGALMEYGFHHLLLMRINAVYACKNLATKRFVNKLGFRFNNQPQGDEDNNEYQYFDQRQWNKSLITKILPNKYDNPLP